MTFLRKLLGIDDDDNLGVIKSEIDEAKHKLRYEQGLYRQAILRTEANSRSLLKTWEAANGMVKGARE